ncbi:MAG TPA: hypothetical protein VF780_03850 [Nitrosospira sp.]
MTRLIITAKSLVLASTLVFTMTGAGLVHTAGAAERDIPDEISPTDVGVRDTDAKGQDRSIKERLHMKEGKKEKKEGKKEDMSSTSTKKPDNSRYSTDGIERYEDEGYGGTGPKREGRY